MSAAVAIRRALAAVVLAVAATGVLAAGEVVTVYKSPSCGCCGAWVDYMRQNGFTVSVHDVDDVNAARRRTGMPQRYGSCHTATVGGYAVEGHVPAREIKRLLAEKPQAAGLAVPGMPAGSPGMESPNPRPYAVLLVEKNGSHRVFARY